MQPAKSRYDWHTDGAAYFFLYQTGKEKTPAIIGPYPTFEECAVASAHYKGSDPMLLTEKLYATLKDSFGTTYKKSRPSGPFKYGKNG